MLDEASAAEGAATQRPSRTYYGAVHGRWRGPFAFTVTDWRAFRAAGQGVLDRLRVVSIALVPRLLGAFLLETSVDARTDPDAVVHTTRLSKWGVTVFRSVETLYLDPNGRDFTMRIKQRLWPAPWRERDEGEGRGRIDESSLRSTYDLPWLGTHLHQIGERDGDHFRLTQETSFSRGIQELTRVA
jgi:hypothetical protein